MGPFLMIISGVNYIQIHKRWKTSNMDLYDLIDKISKDKPRIIQSVSFMVDEVSFTWQVGVDNEESSGRKHALCRISKLADNTFRTYAIDESGEVFVCEDITTQGNCVVVYFQDVNDYQKEVFSRFVSVGGLKFIAPMNVTLFKQKFNDELVVFYGDRSNLFTDESFTGNFAVVDADNFDGDYPNERFVTIPHPEKDYVEDMCQLLNEKYSGEDESRYYKVVQLPYQLQPGFRP